MPIDCDVIDNQRGVATLLLSSWKSSIDMINDIILWYSHLENVEQQGFSEHRTPRTLWWDSWVLSRQWNLRSASHNSLSFAANKYRDIYNVILMIFYWYFLKIEEHIMRCLLPIWNNNGLFCTSRCLKFARCQQIQGYFISL